MKPRRVCSCCRAVLDEGDAGAETTHTLCKCCQANYYRQFDIWDVWEKEESWEDHH
jgi:hypothetical protein